MTNDEIEVPQWLTRKFIKSGGTNPDYLAECAQGIIEGTEKENWDYNYLIEKAERIIAFLNMEQKRLEAYNEQARVLELDAEFEEKLSRDSTDGNYEKENKSESDDIIVGVVVKEKENE